MKTINVWRAVLLLPILLLTALSAFGQNTAFTYSGRLNDNGVPVNSPSDLRFSLFETSAGNDLVAGPLLVPAAAVVNGFFTVRVDFGANVFTGPPRWLGIEARVGGAANFTLLSPRQEVTASPYAIRAQTAGGLANGVLTASQLKIGGAAPVPGQFLSYNEGNFVWTDPGAAVGDVWSRNGSDIFYAAGNVGIGTSAPTVGVRLEVNGPAKVTAGGSGGFLQIGTPNGETGVSINGNNRADLRFNGSSLKLVAGAGSGPPPSENGVNISTNGSVGLGTTNRYPGYRLDVKGATVIEAGGLGGGFMAFGTPSFETGMTISGSGSKRADLRFDGATVKLLASASAGPPPPENGITVHTSGNVGIGGSFNPVAKLEVVGQDALRLIGYQPFLTLIDANAGYANSRIQGVNGEIVLEPHSFVTGSNPNASVVIANSGNVSVRTLTIRGGADLAEPFELSHDGIAKGSVVIIDDEQPGKLKLSTRAYDTRVAGIVSGANGVHPGISLHQAGVLEKGENVALSGRVYVLADATNGAIKPGDLLTTSDTPGHAMKVTNHTQSQGAILGKAMTRLDEGQGAVLVLVTLQ